MKPNTGKVHSSENMRLCVYETKFNILSSLLYASVQMDCDWS